MIRYFQIGIQNENGFTGIAGDFVGGGMFDDTFIFVNGELIDCDIDERTYDYDEKEGFLEEAYPHLLNKIWNVQNEIMVFIPDLEWYVPTDHFYHANIDYDPSKVITNDTAFLPIEIGNTLFSVN